MHTIEAAVCTGTALVLAGILVLSGPAVYRKAREAASAGARSAQCRLIRDELYAIEVFRDGEVVCTSVRTSPEKLWTVAGALSAVLEPLPGLLRSLFDGTDAPGSGE